MKNFIAIFILVFFKVFTSWAGDLKIGLQTGIGFYNMATFSDMTENAKNETSFSTKIISNYPPYLYYQPSLKFSFTNYEFGLIYLFQTTGSRISSKDYSGEYLFDTKINSHSPGIFFNTLLNNYGKFKLYYDIQFGINFSKLKLNEYLRVYDQSSSENVQFTARSLYIKPGLSLSYSWNQFNFALNFGYFKEFSKENYSMVHARQYEIEIKKQFLESDVWDGIRVGLSISYSLLYKKHKESISSGE